jgi:hypothetical protein
MYRTFTKSLSEVNIEELMRTNHFKYVIVQAGRNYHFGFDLLDKVEHGCIFALIHSRDSESIDGWLVSKKLPEGVGDYSKCLTYEKQHTKGTGSHKKDCAINQHGKVSIFPGSISYSGGYDSYEGKGSSEGCSAAYGGLSHKASIDCSRKFNSSKVPVTRKQNLLVDSSEESFSYDEWTKNEENEFLASGSGKQQKLTYQFRL